MTWHSGDRVIVRGADWRVTRSTSFTDCETIDLASEYSAATRTLLAPFDRLRPLSHPRLQVVSRKRWAREVSSLLRASYPYGGLQFCPGTIHLLPYQLEPALATFRHGALRLLIADDVGLGKTVEGGVIVREVTKRDHLSRTLILTPASVRAQWAEELAALFDLVVFEADAEWLRRRIRALPADVNPWSLPGVYLASADFIKRPEVLHPLEDLRWDLFVVDEAHTATPGSDRRAAVHALACRSRRVVLLTATPHSGDDEQFAALCRIGAQADSSPVVYFRRSRADTPLGDQQPRSTVLAVRLTEPEHKTHRLLESYTARLWTESKARADLRGELVATILRKRALSSTVSLGISIRRRLELLTASPVLPSQPILPWEPDDGIEEDASPDACLAGRGLDDDQEERRMLADIRDAAEAAAPHESKPRVLLRLLRRAREPAIIFTEYRDTAEYLHRMLVESGHKACLLHGGLSQKERRRLIGMFVSERALLVATDAASEGLNLHQVCRLVVHFELPWTPSRLHQRCGRVNRIGQARRVHEIALVANDTSEQLVLVPLLQRARRSSAYVRTPLVQFFPESRVAAHVLGGAPLDDGPCERYRAPSYIRTMELGEEARAEVARLKLLRRVQTSPNHRPSALHRRSHTLPVAQTRKRNLRAVTIVLALTLHDGRGNSFEHVPLVLQLNVKPLAPDAAATAIRERAQRMLADLRSEVAQVAKKITRLRLAEVAALRHDAAASLRDRDRHMQRVLRSTARELVQAGLFDRRALRAAAARERTRAILLDDLNATTSADHSTGEAEGSYEIRAILLGELT